MKLRSLQLLLALALPAGAVLAQTPPPRAAPPAPAPRAEAPHPAPAPEPTPRPERARERTPSTAFQVALLAAEESGPSRVEELSAPARKALDDVRGFLPYKSYSVIGLAWIRTDRVAETQVPTPEGNSLHVHLAIDPWRDLGDSLIRVDGFVVALETPSRAPRKLLETSFAISPGETLVVGTSKLDGAERALVVLLTALP